MSLILDALNRAEHDRKNKNVVPDISTVHTLATPVAVAPTTKPMLVLIAISLMVIAIILSVWFFRASSSGAPSSLVPVAALPPVATTVVTESPQVASSASVISSSPTAAPVVTNVAPAIENLYAEKAASAQVPDASVEKLYEPEAEASVSESIVTPFEPEQTHAADFAAVNGAGVQEPEQLVTGMAAKPQRYYDEIAVQDFNSLGWNQKQQIPTISYSRHNFLPQNVSTVVINGETLGEGNAFSNGNFVVDEIFVDGVVLSFRGNKFKLRALSGWVNM